MTKLDQSFFDEYKHLDKLLCDCYLTDSGVTPYINEMAINDEEGREKVKSWQSDLKELKHLRYLRNMLAHETQSQVAEQKDIDSVKEFQVRVTNGDDPLARLEKERAKIESQKKKSSGKKTAQEKISEPTDSEDDNDTSNLPVFVRVVLAKLTVLGISFLLCLIGLLIKNLIK